MIDLSHPPPVPRWLRYWAVATVCAAVPLVLLGAETTTRGVGMADRISVREPWYFFTLDLTDTPLGLLIEHGHRFFGWAVGLCSIVLAFGLTFAARSWHRWLGWPVLLMVGAQGIFGILRVKYNALAGPELAAFHGCFAQLALATIVAVAVFCSQTWSVPVQTPASLRWQGLALCASIFIQIVFGAIVRHLLDPLAQRIHILLAFIVIGLVFLIVGRLRRDGDNGAARRVAILLAGLVLVQPILGVEAWIRRFGSGMLPELVQSDLTLDLVRSGHHVLGTLIFAATVALAVLLWRPLAAIHPSPPTTLRAGSVSDGPLPSGVRGRESLDVIVPRTHIALSTSDSEGSA
jgi:heme A synthase